MPCNGGAFLLFNLAVDYAVIAYIKVTSVGNCDVCKSVVMFVYGQVVRM
jgi:hypothetical protein